MDLKWFHCELKDEVEGAITYIKMAIELKAMSDKMSKTFYEMALQEYEHVKNLYNMAMEYYGKIVSPYTDIVPEYLLDLREKILDCYTSKSVEIKLLISMYKD